MSLLFQALLSSSLIRMALTIFVLALLNLYLGDTLVATESLGSEEVWLPVGTQLTNLGMQYGSDQESLQVDDSADDSNSWACVNGMELVSSLPKYLATEMMDEVTSNKTLDSLDVVQDAEEHEVDVPLTDEELEINEALLDDEISLFQKEFEENNEKEVLDGEKGVLKGVVSKKKIVKVLTYLKIYKKSRCSLYCHGLSCIFARRRCIGLACHLRKCNVNCHEEAADSNECEGRPTMEREGEKYCCVHRRIPIVQTSGNGTQEMTQCIC